MRIFLLAVLCLHMHSMASADVTPLAGPSSLTAGFDFLPHEQAFIPGATYDGDAQLRVYWQIAPGYYLYGHRFAVHDAADNRIEGLVIPQGERKQDEWFGRVEVYYDYVDMRIPVPEQTTDAQTLIVHYQGCAEAGLCYPPIRQRLSFVRGTPGLSLAALATDSTGTSKLAWRLNSTSNSTVAAVVLATAAPSAAPPAVPEATRLATLLEQGTLIWTLALFFLAGIGLAFTPCVLPMVPILSTIIVGAHQPGSNRAALLSFAYILGMATAYAIAGALMGFFGARLNIQSALQNVWLLSGFAAVFALLALAMFGLYELRLPAFVSSRIYPSGTPDRQKPGGVLSVAWMGAASALLVSPCISAPLAGALIYISAYQDVLIGTLALFVLALGMGVPLLIFGFGAGRLLPQAGQWMDSIKQLAGFCLLGLAIWLLASVIPPSASIALWGILAAAIGFWVMTLSKQRRGLGVAGRAASLVLLVYGAALLIGATAGANSLLRPLAPFTADTDSTGFTAALKPKFLLLTENRMQALLSGEVATEQPTMLYVFADWCATCRGIERDVFQDPAVISHFQRMALLKADITDNLPIHQAWLDRFGIFGPPALLFFNADGKELPGYRLQGELSVATFSAHLDSFLML